MKIFVAVVLTILFVSAAKADNWSDNTQYRFDQLSNTDESERPRKRQRTKRNKEPKYYKPKGIKSGCLPSSITSKLNDIRSKFGSIVIISTHRPGAKIAGTNRTSYHASCRAVDFNVPRGKYNQVVKYLKQTWNGGVGTYSCNMHHIHIDNGPKVRFHKCQ